MNEKVTSALKGAGGVAKWAAIIIFGLVALAVGGTAALLLTNSPNRYKPAVVAAVKKATKARKVDFRNFSWNYSLADLSFGIKAENAVIEQAGPINLAGFSSLTVSTQPLKLIFGKLPVKVTGRGGKLFLGRAPKASDLESAKERVGADAGGKLPPWASYLRADLDFALDEISMDPVSFGFGHESALTVKNTSLTATIAGLPGHFRFNLGTELAVDIANPAWSARGPLKASLEGFFQIESGRAVGMRVKNFLVDLDESTITGLDVIEKPSVIPLNFNTEIQLLFNPDLSVKSVELSQAKLFYDNVTLQLSGNMESTKKVLFKWSVGKTELSGFRLPLAKLRSMPLEGILETSGQLQVLPDGPTAGSWRVDFNNIKFNTSEVSERGETKGKVVLSFTSEGALENGSLNSPRTELQVDGTEAEINLWGGRFRKPSGSPFQIMMKSKVEKDNLSVTDFSVTFNSLQAGGTAEVNGVSDYFGGRASPFALTLSTNKVDLSKYSTFFPQFHRPPPLEGFMEFAGSFEGELKRGETGFDGVNWRVDRMNLSNFRTLFERESFVQFGLGNNNYTIKGPVTASFLFEGRGRGTVVDHATLMSQADMSKAAILYHDRVRKAGDVPLMFDVAAEQTRHLLKIRRGNLRFNDLNLIFDGNIQQGSSRSFVDLRMPKPILLSNWKTFFSDELSLPVDGKILWKGRLGFTSPGEMDGNFDWKTLSVEGNLDISELTGRFGDFKNPIRHGNAKISFANDALTIPNFFLEIGECRVGASGKVTFPSTGAHGKKSGNLARLLTREGWDITSAVTMSRLDPSDFESVPVNEAEKNGAPTPEEPSFGAKLKALLESGPVKTGRLQVSLRSPQGNFHDLSFASVNARLLWQKDHLQLEPFGLHVFGGDVRGSAVLNAEKFYARGEAPELSTSVKVNNLNLALLAGYFKPAFGQIIAGGFAGDMTLTSQGFEQDEIEHAVKGRMNGRITDASFETLQVLDKSLGSIIHNSEAKDFLLKQASQEACLKKKFNGDMDMQIGPGGLNFEKGVVAFDTGTSIDFKGEVRKDMEVDLRGDLVAGPKCISGDARLCLADHPGGGALIPFKISGSATSPVAAVDVEAIGRKVASCVAGRIGQRAENAVKTEAKKRAQGGIDQLKQKAVDGFKNLIKGQ